MSKAAKASSEHPGIRVKQPPNRLVEKPEDCFYMDMRGEGMHRMGTNPCASESPRPELSHAQGFISKSLTVASEYSTENPSFSEIRIFSPKFTSFSCIKICT